MMDLIIYDNDYAEAIYIRFKASEEDEIRRYIRHYELDLLNLGNDLQTDGLIEYYAVCSYNQGDLIMKDEEMGFPIEDDENEDW